MSELQKTIDIIIGEATKTLLEADEEINFDTLLRVISERFNTLQDGSLKTAFRHAITEIRGYQVQVELLQARGEDEKSERMLDNSRLGPQDNSH